MTTASIIVNPQFFSPVNAEMWYKFGLQSDIPSASYSQYNMQYYINLNQLSFTGSFIQNLATVYLPPDPTGNAWYDAHKLLQTQIDTPIISASAYGITYSLANSETYIAYDVNYGFQYQPNLIFNTTFDTIGFLSFSFSYPINNTFKSGDIIQYVLDSGSINLNNIGTASITSVATFSFVTDYFGDNLIFSDVFNTTSISVLNVGYTSSYIISGSIAINSQSLLRQYQTLVSGDLFVYNGNTYDMTLAQVYGPNTFYFRTQNWVSNSQESHATQSIVTSGTFSFYNSISNLGIQSGIITNLQRSNGTSSIYYGYNGSRQYNQNYNIYDFTQYVYHSNDQTGKFLTTYNQPKSVFLSNWETLSFASDNFSFNLDHVVVNTYDSNLNFIQRYQSGSIGSLEGLMYVIGSGPQNMLQSGVGLTGVGYYSITIFDPSESNPPAIGTFTYSIISGCSVYQNVRVVFINSFGQLEWFNFNKDNQTTYDIQRTEYRQILAPDYQIGDRGDNILSQKVTQNQILNSDWISEYDYYHLRQLIYSGDAFVSYDNDTRLYPIIITDDSYVVKTAYRNQIFNLTLGFKYAYDINTQNN